MSPQRTVAVLVGSLRKASFSRKVAKALAAVAPDNLHLEIVEIGQLPPYNEDEETAAPPAAWVAFRDQVRGADAVLFVTPEYNRSVPGFLKNAIDVGSRPYGKSVWSGKPGAVVSVSPGALGAFGANHHLRQSLVFLDVPAMQQPEAYIGGAAGLFDEAGTLTNDATRTFPDQVHGRLRRLDRGQSQGLIMQNQATDPAAWPALSYETLKDTCETLQLWTQVVGKVRLAQTPWLNHSWHVPLYVTARGLTTSLVPHPAGAFDLEFDFVDEVLRLRTSNGAAAGTPLEPQRPQASTTA